MNFFHMKILKNAESKSVFISVVKKSQKMTEFQINNIIKANKSVMKTKMISIIFKKISTANAVEVSNIFNLLLISLTNAIKATNILQTNHNLISNFIEVSNTALNSKNFDSISHSLSILSANVIETTNVLQTNYNFNSNFIENISNFNLISRSLAKKIQYRKKFAERI